MAFYRIFGGTNATLLGLGAIATSALIAIVPQSAIAQTLPGQGTLTLQGRPNREIVSASVTTYADNRTEMAFQMSDGNTLRFTGRYQGQTDSTQVGVTAIRLTGSGDANASGLVNLTYVGGRISQIEANGTLDGQPFTIRFSTANESNSTQTNLVRQANPTLANPTSPTRPTTQANPTLANPTSPSNPVRQTNPTLANPTSTTGSMAQTNPTSGNPIAGRGTVAFQGRLPVPLNQISVANVGNQLIEITLLLSDGNTIRLTGETENRTVHSASEVVPVSITSSGNARASGTVTLRYVDGNVRALSGGGILDGQNFFVNFTRSR